jgi:hypothetical protein
MGRNAREQIIQALIGMCLAIEELNLVATGFIHERLASQSPCRTRSCRRVSFLRRENAYGRPDDEEATCRDRMKLSINPEAVRG